MSAAAAVLQPETIARLHQAWDKAFELLAPPPELLVSQWAEQNRILPKGTTNRPGPWITESFQQEMMNAILAPEVREVVCMKSTQVGWTDGILNNVLAYYIDADPKPIMMVLPRDTDAKDKSKKVINPMIQACPALRGKVRQNVSRRSGNTILLKEFDGGFLKITGANSGAGLRSDPIAVLLLDEVDAYPDDVDGEGSPVAIAERRTDTFDDAKILKGSTPAKPRGLSTIERDFNRSDQRRFYVPCPFCGHEQVLWWRDPVIGQHRLVWEKDGAGLPIPSTVRYLCAGCGQGIDEKFKQRMLEAGRWIAAHPERTTVVGFHINALYSPWRPIWHELAKEWVEAQENPEALKAFVNLRLGETWDEGAETFDATTLSARREEYAAEVPAGACVLVAAADVQNNRIEAQVKAFGPGEEEWLIAHEVFWGNPGTVGPDPQTGVDVWEELDTFLLREWQHECGARLRPVLTLVDSGAHADAVYDFVMPRQNAQRHVFACKGVDYLSKPGLVSEGTTKRGNIRLWTVSTYAAKDRIFARLKIPKPGPGYQHFPDWVTDEYFLQLTGEQKTPVRNRRTRTTRYIYIKTYHRNEALDLTVYCHAGLFVCQRFVDPVTFSDLGRLLAVVQQGQNPFSLQVPRVRRVRSAGI